MRAAGKESKGCCFWGCLGLTVVVALLAIGLFGITYAVKQTVSGLVEQFTDEAPRALPVVEVPTDTLDVLRERVLTFRDAIKDEESSARLELTADDLNALVQHDAEFSDLKGKVYFDIQDDQLKGEVSIPLKELDLPGDKDRYFNGSAVFDISISERQLSVVVVSAEINGNALPGSFIDVIRGKNILQDAQFGDEADAVIRRLKSLEIEDGRLVLELVSEAELEGGSPAGEQAVPEVDKPAEFDL